MGPLTYYHDFMSQPCRAVYIFLKMTGISYQSKEIALRKAEHLTDDYVAINPFKKVPTIDDSGFILTESVAIMQYLADKHQRHDWYPTDLKDRARVNEYTHWQHLNLRLTGSMLFQTKIVIPRATGKPIDTRALENWHKKWLESTAHLEQMWLKRSPYLAGKHLTIADLSGICEMMQPIAGGYDLDRKQYPRVHEWMESVKKETQPHFDQAHVISMRLRESILKEEKKSKS